MEDYIKNQKMSAKSVKDYCESVEDIMKIARFVGLNLLDKDYKRFNKMSLALVADILGFLIVSAYCIHEFIGNLEKLVFCSLFLGFSIQVKIIVNLNALKFSFFLTDGF